MKTPHEDEPALRILSIGLLSEELTLLKRIVSNQNGTIITASDDLDLWNHARYKNYDLCILGQSDTVSSPSYILWLLKGIFQYSRILSIYSSITQEEMNRLKRYNVPAALHRPISVETMAQAVESILDGSTERREKRRSILAHFIPTRLQSWFHT